MKTFYSTFITGFQKVVKQSFYEKMLAEFRRLLMANGLLVVLIAKKELFETVLKKFADDLELLARYDTLVSGQKTGVYKIKKLAKKEGKYLYE